jgi:hypothetical protein
MTNAELAKAVMDIRDDVITANMVAMDLRKEDGIGEERRNLVLSTLNKVGHAIDVIMQEVNAAQREQEYSEHDDTEMPF